MPNNALWRQMVMENYVEMKNRNPRATLGDAMVAAKVQYWELKNRMFQARKVVAAGYRQKARDSTGPKVKFYEDRAHKTEVAQYTGVLEDLKW
jgi:hypothetical protein